MKNAIKQWDPTLGKIERWVPFAIRPQSADVEVATFRVGVSYRVVTKIFIELVFDMPLNSTVFFFARMEGDVTEFWMVRCIGKGLCFHC